MKFPLDMREFHSSLFGTGPAPIGHHCTGADVVSLLDHAGPLPRSDLRLDRVVVIYSGDRRYPLTDKADVLPLSALQELWEVMPVSSLKSA